MRCRAEGKRVLLDDPARFDAVTAFCVDEHICCHTRRGDKYATVIIGLTPVRAGIGPARPHQHIARSLLETGGVGPGL